jgi:hypothetical protein
LWKAAGVLTRKRLEVTAAMEKQQWGTVIIRGDQSED